MSQYIKKQQNRSLQGLRGLLALLVVLFHCYKALESLRLVGPVGGYMHWVEGIGMVSVNLFFVISGYLIIQSLNRHKNLKKFFTDRVLRIYPVFLVIHLLIFSIGPVIDYKWMTNLPLTEFVFHFFSNLLLLPGIFPSLPEAQIVAWSISYEFLFYILAGAIFGGLTNKGRGRSYYVLFIALLVSILFVYFHPRALYFIVGLVLYKFIGLINSSIPSRVLVWLDGLILLGLAFLSYLYVHLSISLLLALLLFISVINESGLLSRGLQSSALNYLGNISYSLYLWHTFVMFPIKTLILVCSAYIQSPLFLFLIFTVLSTACSIVVSHYSYKFIEQRFTKYVKSELYSRQNPHVEIMK